VRPLREAQSCSSTAIMGANLPFYVVANILWLWVLPALEHELETVAVRIEFAA
jgi:hypothetical protein